MTTRMRKLRLRQSPLAPPRVWVFGPEMARTRQVVYSKEYQRAMRPYKTLNNVFPWCKSLDRVKRVPCAITKTNHQIDGLLDVPCEIDSMLLAAGGADSEEAWMIHMGVVYSGRMSISVSRVLWHGSASRCYNSFEDISESKGWENMHGV